MYERKLSYTVKFNILYYNISNYREVMVLYITYIFGFLEPFSAFLLVKENSIYQSKVVVPVCNLSNPDPTLGKDRIWIRGIQKAKFDGYKM